MTAAGTTAPDLGRLVLGVGVLALVAAGALRAGQVRLGAVPYLALLRGAAQLAVVGLVLRAALTHPLAVAGVLLVMLAVAVRTSSGRMPGLPHHGQAVAVAVAAGTAAALGPVFALGVLPAEPRYVVALAGIVIGNAMTAATLTGRRFAQGLADHRDEVEGWFALGATPRQACADVARTAVREALLPGID